MTQTPHTATAPSPVGLIDARGQAPWRIVAGISLVMRLVRSFELAGVQRIAVVSDRVVDATELGATRSETRLSTLRLAEDVPLSEAALDSAGADVLVVDGALVVDRRLLAALVRASAPTRVPTPPAGGVRLARVSAVELTRCREPAGADWSVLDPGDLPTWDLKMRGHQDVLLLDASTPDAARQAETLLVHRTQKSVMDWPARWIDPPVENALLRRLAPTRVGPDGVTWFGAAIALLAAALLWHGWLVSALPLMLLVGWLDGVDGKLARLRLKGGWVGEHEAIVDFFVENAWYVALTAWFHGSGHGEAAIWAGAIFVAANLVDELAYTFANPLLGRSLDLLTPADGAFRLVAGRRNVYVWYLVVAFLTGFAWEGFVLCAGWALMTGLVHAVRLVVAVLRGEAQK